MSKSKKSKKSVRIAWLERAFERLRDEYNRLGLINTHMREERQATLAVLHNTRVQLEETQKQLQQVRQGSANVWQEQQNKIEALQNFINDVALLMRKSPLDAMRALSEASTVESNSELKAAHEAGARQAIRNVQRSLALDEIEGKLKIAYEFLHSRYVGKQDRDFMTLSGRGQDLGLEYDSICESDEDVDNYQDVSALSGQVNFYLKAVKEFTAGKVLDKVISNPEPNVTSTFYQTPPKWGTAEFRDSFFGRPLSHDEILYVEAEMGRVELQAETENADNVPPMDSDDDTDTPGFNFYQRIYEDMHAVEVKAPNGKKALYVVLVNHRTGEPKLVEADNVMEYLNTYHAPLVKAPF